MAAIKSKKPVSKKLKASKKKKTNKWLILGGVVAVAIIGALVVRFSSASQWVAAYYNNTQKYSLGAGDSLGLATPTIRITKGNTYRFCARGVSSGKTTLKLSLLISDVQPGPNERVRAVSTKSYGKGSELHCSAEFRATKDYRATGYWEHVSGSRMTVTSRSIDYLR